MQPEEISDAEVREMLDTPEAREALYVSAVEDAQRFLRRYDVSPSVIYSAANGATEVVVASAAYESLHKRFSVVSWAAMICGLLFAADVVARLAQWWGV